MTRICGCSIKSGSSVGSQSNVTLASPPLTSPKVSKATTSHASHGVATLNTSSPTRTPTSTSTSHSSMKHEVGPIDSVVWSNEMDHYLTQGFGSQFSGGAANFYAIGTAAIQRYQDVNAAIAAGYEIDGHENGIGFIHAPNKRLLNDGGKIDPSQPDELTYQRSADGRLVLTGALYRTKDAPPPNVGPEMVWHGDTADDLMVHMWLNTSVADGFTHSKPSWVKNLR